MTSITLYNKGKRTWTDLRNSAGEVAMVKPEGSIEMEEAAGLRMLVDYPREFTSSKIAGPSSEDLARREQSLRDREANLTAREKAIGDREREIVKKTADLEATIQIAITGEKTDIEGLISTDDARADLVKEAEALGLKVDGRMGIVKIKAMIDEAKAAK